jgi:hypothetical protein
MAMHPESSPPPSEICRYDERGRPMHDDDGNRMKSYIVVLNPSPIFVKYALGNQVCPKPERREIHSGQ